MVNLGRSGFMPAEKPVETFYQPLYQPSVFQLAQEGHFRAIAYWINVHLVPQGIYVCVSAAPQPGYLLILIEFQRIPERDRLIRFICHRISRLNSSIIQGVQIVARQMGTSTLLWNQSIRLLTPGGRRTYPHTVKLRRSRQTPHLNIQKTAQTVQETAQVVHNYLKRLQIQAQLQEHLKNPHSQVLAKSALAAFVIGCGFEMVKHTANTALNTIQPSASQVASGGDRPNTVQAALEKLNVTQIANVNLEDPSVTLTFSGEGAIAQPTSASPSNEQEPPSQAATASQADVALVILEPSPASVATAEAPTGAPSTNGSPTATVNSLDTLSAKGVDIVNLATDQLVEPSASRLAQTIRSLEQAGIQPVGAGRNQREARRPEIIDVKGQRLAYLGYSNSNDNAAGAWSAGLNPALKDQIAVDIKAIREQVDWVVVNYHWNQELTTEPADWQKDLAYFAIDQGADLVVGYHPDALQGAEVYKGRAIAYSLGNFIFSDSSTASPAPQRYDTAVLKVSLREQQMRLEFLPVQVRDSKPQIVNGEKAAEILQRIQQASAQFEQPIESPMTLDVRSQAESTPVNTPTLIEPEVDALLAPEDSPLQPDAPAAGDSSPADIPSGSSSDEPSPADSPDSESFPTPSGVSPASPATEFITYPDSPENTSADEAEQPQPAYELTPSTPASTPSGGSPQALPATVPAPVDSQPQPYVDGWRDSLRSPTVAPQAEPTAEPALQPQDQNSLEESTVQPQALEPAPEQTESETNLETDSEADSETELDNQEDYPAAEPDDMLPQSQDLTSEPVDSFEPAPEDPYLQDEYIDSSEPVAEDQYPLDYSPDEYSDSAVDALEPTDEIEPAVEEPFTETDSIDSADTSDFPYYPGETPIPDEPPAF